MSSPTLVLPRILHSDNGREFVNSIVHSVTKEWQGDVARAIRQEVGHGHSSLIRQEIGHRHSVRLAFISLLRQTIGNIHWTPITSGGVQLRNQSNTHWLCVSTIECSPGEAALYDSLLSKTKVYPHITKQIATIRNAKDTHLTIKIMHSQGQTGTNDWAVCNCNSHITVLQHPPIKRPLGSGEDETASNYLF